MKIVKIIAAVLSATMLLSMTACGKTEEKTVSGIKMQSMPTKTTYYVGDAFQLGGATISVTYSDGSQQSVAVTADMIQTPDMSKVGVKTVRVTYMQKITQFQILVGEAIPEPPTEADLSEMRIAFLGSSVTYGSASGGKSFVEFLSENTGCEYIKEAVSGTTLVDNGASSYVQRMKTMPTNKTVDAFVCQLSTNDASQNKPLGEVAVGTALNSFNTATVTGAMEYIICYATNTYGCPVIFYTGTKYQNTLYKQMVDRLYELQDKYDIGIIDLYNDEEMNAVSSADYNRYMSDSIHPTLIGYRDWWTPKFESYLKTFLANR